MKKYREISGFVNSELVVASREQDKQHESWHIFATFFATFLQLGTVYYS